jgi:glycosyltransferase involved in cell wall biosynthesis
MKPKIIFILPNIYECINGVSTKYIKFIEYLLNKDFYITLIIPFINHDLYDNLIKHEHLNIIKVNGMTIPFYKEIKIPIIQKKTIEKELENKNEIIIFNGEFIWLYTLLKKLKKKYENLKIYPNMHTNYIHYAEKYYDYLNIIKKLDISILFNHMNIYLEEKIFSGIIVTGEDLKKKYINFTENIFNANEVDLSVFSSYKIDIYSKNELFNILFCGRISKEKNIDEVIECCNLLYNKEIINFNLHIIGDGPYLNDLKEIIINKYSYLNNIIIFHGSLKHNEIYNLYHKLHNRIFLFASLTETFGKTPFEACCTGIPIFIKKCDLTEKLYINKKNAFLFNDQYDFIEIFKYFLKMTFLEKNNFIYNSINNVKKYDQIKIFNDWLYFLVNTKTNNNYKKINTNFFEIFTFQSITKMINCSGTILGD